MLLSSIMKSSMSGVSNPYVRQYDENTDDDEREK
jgi:hypothetical protein